VYNPVLLMVPRLGCKDQVTAVLAEPVTVAVICCVPPATVLNTVGVTASVIGVIVTADVACSEGLLTLRAVTTTFCGVETEPGALYMPVLSMVPMEGLTDHVTALFAAPVTVAVNCCEAAASTDMVDGDKVSETGLIVMVDVAVSAGFAVLCAVTTTLC
jgi:hypothetical protein